MRVTSNVMTTVSREERRTCFVFILVINQNGNMAGSIGNQAAQAAQWAQQYSTLGSQDGGAETPMHENPEWEKARQALASISKGNVTGAGGNKESASSQKTMQASQYAAQPGDPSALQQQQYYQWYQQQQQYNYAYSYNYYYPLNMYSGYSAPGQYGVPGSYPASAQQQQGAPVQHQGNPIQPPIPGMDDGISYSTVQSQPTTPTTPQSPQQNHTVALSNQQGTGGGSQHPLQSSSSSSSMHQPPSYNQTSHTYADSPKQKKGQLWNRMKRKFVFS
ncbi:leukocyte receptor cluster member 8-like [Protopterus annectens]|uniref:leukocyte receptor cluster member 8-like n=1 Tax=Protopterus annectens TaxID=7888 RepID=UPI001CF9D20B|nr:leukocyte receptor cluster member 8-like [Protopterus annectens]